jgi:hypothetical protein
MSGRKVMVVLLFVVIVGLSCLATVHNPSNPDTTPLQPFGRYTARQMINRATPIFRLLLPQQPDMLLTAEPTTELRDDRALRRYWNIDCTNERGDVLARLVCDADSGDMRNVARNGLIIDPSAAKVTQAHPITRQETLQRTQAWLRILGFTQNWRIEGVTQHGGSARDIRMITGDRQANLVIDSSTGTLLFAAIQPAP